MAKKFPKRLFERMLRLSYKYSALKLIFDKKVTDIFGIHYSDVDDDGIIDAIDYGIGGINYDEFCHRMAYHAKENKLEEGDNI